MVRREGIMKVLVVGVGPVGLAVTNALVQSDHDVDLLARPSLAPILERDGIIQTGVLGNSAAPPETFRVYTDPADLPSHHYAYVLLCTKAYDLESTIAALACTPGVLSPLTTVVLWQNGWGNIDRCLPYVSPYQLACAVTCIGFRKTLTRVEVTAYAKPIHIGSCYDTDVRLLFPLADALTTGGLPCHAVPDISKDQGAKLLLNSTVNGLSALFAVPCRALATSVYARQLMDGLIAEAFTVMQHAGFHTHWQSADDYRAEFYKRLLPAIGAHETAMLHDLRAGRRTEIDWLNGAIIHHAAVHGLAVPHHLQVFHSIKFLEDQVCTSRSIALAPPSDHY